MPHAVKDKVESSYKHTRAHLARIHNASAVRSFIWSTCSVSHAKIKWGWFEFVVYVFLSAPKFWDLGLFGNVFFFPQHPQRLGVVFCCSLQFFSHVWWGLGVLFGLCPFFEKRHAPFVGRVCVCIHPSYTGIVFGVICTNHRWLRFAGGPGLSHPTWPTKLGCDRGGMKGSFDVYLHIEVANC